MLNKWTILFQIKEARDRRIRVINKRTREEIWPKIIEDIFFTDKYSSQAVIEFKRKHGIKVYL